MSDFPPIDWGLVASAAATMAPKEPATPSLPRRETVVSLRRLSEQAHNLAVEVSGLPAPGRPLPCEVVGRGRWLQELTTTAQFMLAEITDVSEPRGFPQQVVARALALQIAAPLAWLSGRIVGQFDPYGPHERLLVVAPNVLTLERDLGLASDDFRLWVLVHEHTHRLQWYAAPWLREHVLALMRRAVDDGDAVSPRRGRTLADLLTSPAQHAALDEVTALMSVLEGHAEVMTDRVSSDVIGSVAHIRAQFTRRRQRGGIDGLLRRLLGFEAKVAQYADGATFCRAVIAALGVDGLHRVFEGPTALPTLDELHTPERWVERMSCRQAQGPDRRTQGSNPHPLPEPVEGD